MSRLVKLSVWLLAAGLAVTAPIAAYGAARASASPDPALPPTGPASNAPAFYLRNPHPCVRDSVVLVIARLAVTPCDSFIAAFARDPSHVVYHTEVKGDTCAFQGRLIELIPIALGLFPEGPQRIEIDWVIDHREPDGTVRTETRSIPIEFMVSAVCGVPPGELPFVERVQIGPTDGRNPPCIVPGDSIPVTIAGHFPNGCYSLRSIELIPDRSMSPLPHSPGIRLTVEDCACCAVLCDPQPQAFSASIQLPPLGPFAYALPVELVHTSCNTPVERFAARFPFVVADSCGPRPGCILPAFQPLGPPPDCDARVAPGQPAKLTLYLRSSQALAGLQGELAFTDTTLLISTLAPAGPAQGMLLRWESTQHGAKFALVTSQGAPIPPARPGDPAPPVLDIEVTLAGRPAPVTLLRLLEVLAVDEAGHTVPWCPTLIPDVRYAPPTARICAGPAGPCDFNGDGLEDIRDLVLMLRCLSDPTLCGDRSAGFDCNQDGSFTIDDVLCCAERIVGQDCAGCPPGETRDPGNAKLSFGVPFGRIESPSMPVRIEGAGSIGGARLALRYPSDRYDVSGVDWEGAAASWLHVSEVSDGRILLGLIDPSMAPENATDAVITLRLALKPGRDPGGDVSLEGADLTAHDGVRLAAGTPALRQPLTGLPRLSLSASRPNPFAAETRFAVTVDRAGPVDIAIFDLGGRRLVTLQRGELPAGTREFRWDGRLADGTRARAGLYFYRATAGGETRAQKLVLLRSP